MAEAVGPKKGVFWVLEDDEILAVPFGKGDITGVAKSGDTYNHKLLWDTVKPKGCNKPFDYYPRGRVEISNKGKTVIYMNPNIEEMVWIRLSEAFGLHEKPVIHYNGSEHYKCYLDRQ